MGQLNARLSRGYPAVGTTLERVPAMSAPPEWDGLFNRRKSDRVSPSRPVVPAANAGVRRVVLVEGDQYYREMLTGELLRQGFVVHAFTDGASLLGSLATAVDADLAVLDWDLPRMSGIKLMAELRRQDVNLPVVLLTGQVITGDGNDRCLLAPRQALDAYECMAFDQGAVDFIPKSRDREVLVRRLRNVVELVKPKANAALEEHLACDRLRLKPETSRALWNGVDVERTVGDQAHPQQIPRLRPHFRRDRELHWLRVLLAQAGHSCTIITPMRANLALRATACPGGTARRTGRR